MEPIIAKRLANDLMHKHGLIALGWKFTFDSAKRRFGVCNYTNKIIGLSLPITKLNDEYHVKDTILHEIAHALVGSGHGHDNVWKRKCIEIGAKPERCYSSVAVTQPTMNYHAECPACQRVWRRVKKPQPDMKISCTCQGGLPWSQRKLLNYQSTK